MGKINCPHCQKLLEYKSTADLPHFPFCSERCKLVDLGLWLDGKHRISEELIGDKPAKSQEQEDRGKTKQGLDSK